MVLSFVIWYVCHAYQPTESKRKLPVQVEQIITWNFLRRKSGMVAADSVTKPRQDPIENSIKNNSSLRSQQAIQFYTATVEEYGLIHTVLV